MDAARDAAEERLTDELNADGNKLQRFARAVWKGNIAKEYYRQQYILEAHKKIVDSNDVYTHTQAQDAHKAEALTATIDRFTKGDAETIHDEAGESREVLAEDDELSVVTKDLVRKYASGTIDEAALREEQARVVGAYRAAHGSEAAKRGMVQIDNILQVARAVKGAVEHGESLDAVTREMNVSIGSARNSVRTSHTKTWTDKAIEKVGKSKIGRLSFVTPDMIVAGTSIAASVARVGSTSLLGAIGKTLVPGAAAGVIAGAREARQVRKERVQHMREMAQGSEFDDSNKRRKQMEENRYDTRSATEEAKRLQEMLELESFQDGDTQSIGDTLRAVGDIQSRIRQSDADGIDRLTYSNVVSVGQERFDLDLTLAKAKVALREKLATADPAELARELGMDATLPIDQLVEQTQQLYENEGRQDVTAKDEVFKKLRRKRVLGQAALGAGTGMLIGVGVQEAMAAISPTRVGLIDNITQQDTKLHEGRAHTTLAESIREALPFDDNQLPDYGPGISERQDGHGQFRVAGGTAIVEGDKMKLVSADGNLTVEAIPMNGDGSVSDDVRQQLEAQGLVVESEQVSTEQVITETRSTNAQGYVTHHLDKTALVTRDIWYDNDTSAFDLNELGLWAGGENGSGINADGSYSYSVAAMAEDGSFTSDQSIAWQSAAESGALKFAISATEGTQTQPFMLGVNPDGSINVPADHPAAKLFSVENGRLQFNGAYGEVVQTTGVDANGVEHVRPLATMVGNNTFDGAPIEVTEKTSQNSYVTTITMPEPERFTEMAPVVPVTGRRSMERVRRERPPGSPYMPGYYDIYGSGPDSEARRQWNNQIEADRMPELRSDPQARVALSEALDWHAQRTREKDDEYADDIERLVKATPELATLGRETKAIVTIPVGAKFESENIYRTLSLYGRQEDKAKQETLILMHVNWIDADENDPKVIKTKQQIERAKRDYPDLRISIIETAWSKQKIDEKGYGDRLIGHVSQKMYDAAFTAVRDAISDGRMDANDDVLVIKNDADALGMDRRYLGKMIKGFEEHPENDTFTGGVRWGTSRYGDLPGFGFVASFAENARVASQLKGIDGFQSSFGVNTAARMSTFAAVGGIGHYGTQEFSEPDDLAIAERVSMARNALSPHNGGVHQYGANGQTKGNHDYHRHVVGAVIDSDASRMEKAYVEGRTITETWAGVNEGGWAGRSQGLEGGKKENVRRDADKIARRIEDNMSALMNSWVSDEKRARATLAFMLPGPDQLGGKLAYRISEKDGRKQFTLTPQGEKWLMSRFTTSVQAGKRTRDTYGQRIARQLYGRQVKGARVKPKYATPRMVGGN